jgi:hypothetical protein
MRRWEKAGVALIAIIWSAAGVRLHGATLGFDDLGPVCSPGVPANYQGLIWSANFQVECNADYASTYGNSYGAPSGFAATNGGALLSGLSEISISGGTFDFVSADFSSFAGSNSFQAYSAESLAIYGFRPGDDPSNPTFIVNIDLDPTTYVPQTLNFTGIDDLIFGAGNGPALDPSTILGVDGLSWLMTDVSIDVNSPGTVPEPAPSLLLAAGMAIFAVRRKFISREEAKH